MKGIKKRLMRHGYYVDKLKRADAFKNPVIIDLLRSVDVLRKESTHDHPSA